MHRSGQFLDLDTAVSTLLDSAAKLIGRERSRPRLIVIPEGPERFLAPVVKRFWPHNVPRAVYVPARELIEYGSLARAGMDPFARPSVIFFEPLDEIETNTT